MIHRIILGSLVAVTLSAAAWAQDTADITDDQLEQFVDVQSDMQEITQEYSSRLESVEDPDEAAALQQEASQLMVDAVEEIGLGVEAYNNIAIALESDEDLREEVEGMMEE